jgi:hypothetical protein
MSEDEELNNIVRQLESLQIQQAALTNRLGRLVTRQRERRPTVPAARETTAPRAATPDPIYRAFTVGDRVRIKNPNRLQPTFAIIIKIGADRITLKGRNGGKNIYRAPHNLEQAPHIPGPPTF